MTRAASLALLFVTMTTAACARSEPPLSAAAEGPAVSVAVARAAAADLPQRFEAGGIVSARETATIASRVTAPIEAVYVTAGARVRRGDALVRLESRELQANSAGARAAVAAAVATAHAADAEVQATESSLTLARATHERVRSLFDRRSATPQEWDQASAGLREAEARAAAARAQATAAAASREAADAAQHATDTALSYATLTAPFDGVVAERLVDPGTLATAGMPLVVVEDPSRRRLHVLVDESRARAIAVGQPAEVRLDRDAGWTAARIVEIGRVDAASHNFLVKLDLPGPAVASGLFGRARFTSAERRALTVPAAAIVRRGQLTFVYTVTPDGIARLRAIVPGDTADGRVEILAGLSDGDVAVLNPPPTLADGTRVVRKP